MWVGSLAVSGKEPRSDERAAADVICAVESVVAPPEYEPNGRDTAPDWRVKLAGGRVADVEVRLVTDEDTRSLIAEADGKTWPADELSCEWHVMVSFVDGRGRDRDFNELVKELRGVLCRVESDGCSVRDMLARANKLLDPQCYRTTSESWLGNRTLPRSAGDREALMRANCDYWLVQDIIDLYTRGIEPRYVKAYGCKPGGPRGGRIVTCIGPVEGGAVSLVDALVPAVQRCIGKKQQRLAGAPDLRWLVVVLDDGLPAMQLQRAFTEDAPFLSAAEAADDPDDLAQLGDIRFPGIDEVWVVGPSRLGKYLGDYFMVLRMVGTGSDWTRTIYESAEALGTNWHVLLDSPTPQSPTA